MTVRVTPNVCVSVPDVAVMFNCDVLTLGELVTPRAQPLSMLPVRSIRVKRARAT